MISCFEPNQSSPNLVVARHKLHMLIMCGARSHEAIQHPLSTECACYYFDVATSSPLGVSVQVQDDCHFSLHNIIQKLLSAPLKNHS